MSPELVEAVELADVLASTGEGQRLRRDADLSVAAVAALADVPPADVAAWESGTMPEGDQGATWAAVVDVLAEAEARDLRAAHAGGAPA